MPSTLVPGRIARSMASHLSSRRFARYYLALTLVSAVVWLASACAEPSRGPTPTGILAVGGSGAAYPAIRALAEAFSLRQPGVTFDFPPSSQTATAIREVMEGKLDVGSAARPLAPEEQRPGLLEVLVATDGVAIAVRSNLAVAGLSTEQVRSIYRGEISSWAQLGGPEIPIIVVDRPEDETAKLALRRFVLGQELAVRSGAAVVAKESDMIKAVAGTPGAIGYFALSHVLRGQDDVKALALDGVHANLDNVRNGSYRVARPIAILVKDSATQRPPLREFIEFVQSPDATAALEAAGYARPR